MESAVREFHAAIGSACFNLNTFIGLAVYMSVPQGVGLRAAESHLVLPNARPTVPRGASRSWLEFLLPDTIVRSRTCLENAEGLRLAGRRGAGWPSQGLVPLGLRTRFLAIRPAGKPPQNGAFALGHLRFAFSAVGL